MVQARLYLGYSGVYITLIPLISLDNLLIPKLSLNLNISHPQVTHPKSIKKLSG